MEKNFKDLMPGDKVYYKTLDEKFIPSELKESHIQNIEDSTMYSMWITIENFNEVIIDPNRDAFVYSTAKTGYIYFGTSEDAVNKLICDQMIKLKKNRVHQKYMLEQKIRNAQNELERVNKELEYLKCVEI